jgi:fucose permease
MTSPPAALLLLAYAAFVSLGLPDTVLGVAWPSLRHAFGLSQASLGAVLGATVVGYFASGLVAGRLVARVGVGGLLAASSGAVALGLAGYAAAPSFGLFVPIGAVVGLGSGAVDAALNGYAARHFPARHLQWLHACYSLGATGGPAIMTAVLASGAAYQVGYAVLAGALGAMAVAFAATRRRWDDSRGAAGGARPPDAGAGAALRRGVVWLQVATFFVYTGLESAAGQWCFTVLREGRALSVEAAGAWTSAYWGSIALGRVALGFAVERVGPDRLVRAATLGAVAGSAAFALLPGAAGRVGLVLLGASLAPVFPALMSRTPARVGQDVAQHAVGFQVAAATLGVAAFPSAFGLLAARAGLDALAVAALAVAAALAALHEALLRGGRARGP